jgi:hypothetical protein
MMDSPTIEQLSAAREQYRDAQTKLPANRRLRAAKRLVEFRRRQLRASRDNLQRAIDVLYAEIRRHD